MTMTTALKTMGPAGYAVWLCDLCLARAGDEFISPAGWNQLRAKIEAARQIMQTAGTHRKLINLEEADVDFEAVFASIDEVICYVYPILDLSEGKLQLFLSWLLGIIEAATTARDHPDATYTCEGAYIANSDGFVEAATDHSTRTGDARSTCNFCLKQCHDVLRPHVFFIEAIADERVSITGLPSEFLCERMVEALEGVESTLSRVPPANLTNADFVCAIRNAREAMRYFILLCQLDPQAAASERWGYIRNTLMALLRNLELAQQDPTGCCAVS